MTSAPLLVVAGCSLFVSAWLTGRVRTYVLARGLLDVPNARSSHAMPTARGGGVAIVITMMLAMPALAALHATTWRETAVLLASGLAIAAIGFADDRGAVTLLPRFATHFAAAILVALALGCAAVSGALYIPNSLSWVSTTITVLYAVWMLNLTNFMDGIDGLAGVEVVTTCTGAALCGAITLHSLSASSSYAILLAAAVAGFLMWNWPPAKIFMGDVGSGFLGITVAALSLIAGGESTNLFWCWLVLAGVFVVDATITLFVRVLRREAFYKAHRSHAYQHAARTFSHKRVTVAVLLINVFWLLPLALCVAMTSLQGPLAIAIAYTPLAAVALFLRAGQPE